MADLSIQPVPQRSGARPRSRSRDALIGAYRQRGARVCYRKQLTLCTSAERGLWLNATLAFRVSGFGFRVSDFFRISAVGFRICQDTIPLQTSRNLIDGTSAIECIETMPPLFRYISSTHWMFG